MSRTLSANLEYRRSCRKYLENLLAQRDFHAACRYFDSIKGNLKDVPDVEGGIILRLAAKAFGFAGDLSQALPLVRKSINILTKKVGEADELAECYVVLGVIHRDTGKLAEAEKAFHDAESIFRRNENYPRTGITLNYLADVLYQKGEYDASLKQLLNSEEYAKKSGDNKKLAYLFGNIGRVYTLLGRLNAAEEYLRLNIELSSEYNDEIELGRAYLELGYVLIKQGKFDEAEKALADALPYLQKNNMTKELLIHLTFSAELMLATERLDEAETALNHVCSRARKLYPDSLVDARPIRLLAEIMLTRKSYRKALVFANKAMVLMKKIGDAMEIGALKKIQAVCYDYLGKEEKAVEIFADAIISLEECRAKYELADCLTEAGKSTAFGTNQRIMYLCRAEELYRVCGAPFRITEIQKLIGGLDTHRESSLATLSKPDFPAGRFQTKNAGLKQIVQQLHLLKNSDLPILLTGETGTGKDYLARYFHTIARPDGPFVPINCAALPETLLESELFGYHRGAFTGAERNRNGLFLAANNGVLLLDEIGDMPLRLQAKLLDVIETRKLRPLGSTTEVKVDVIIVAATNRNLLEMVENGSFRRDLYYRLAGITFELPPLRERKEDIPQLIEHFMREHKLLDGHKKPETELIRNFISYEWPGNVRQLENEIKQLSVMAEMAKDGSLVDLSRSIFNSKREEASNSLQDKIEQLEKRLLTEAMIAAGGNKSEAARQLKIHESTLRSKLIRYGLNSMGN